MKVAVESIAVAVLEELIAYGVTDFCIAPGGRNAAFVAILKREKQLNCLYFNDERSAAFFALGRSRGTKKPIAVIVTSGTAIAHLLAAAMEAYYTSVPLVLITADRPRRFRGSNAPQSCEQVGIYGQYAPCQLDLADGEVCSLAAWDRKRPLHLNVCLEEPQDAFLAKEPLLEYRSLIDEPICMWEKGVDRALDAFLKASRYPFVVVSCLKEAARETVAAFLQKLSAPVYLEGISGLREDARLSSLSIGAVDKLWERSAHAGYPIDAVLRIGGVPTPRFWRDLEQREGKIPVFSLNEDPYSGLSWGSFKAVNLQEFFETYEPHITYGNHAVWKAEDTAFETRLRELYEEEPYAEPSLIYALSKKIPQDATLFLGQSLPIRTWDMAATREKQQRFVHASRGLNGIDGQLSTFLGLSTGQSENWGILGDLTALHDLGGWWILPQLPRICLRLVVVNNGGGRIFSRMFSDREIQNEHSYHFEAVGKLWNVPYVYWEEIPDQMPPLQQMLIELVPDTDATNRFWKKYG